MRRTAPWILRCVPLVLVLLSRAAFAGSEVPPDEEYARLAAVHRDALLGLRNAERGSREAKAQLKEIFAELEPLGDAIREPMLTDFNWPRDAHLKFAYMYNVAILLHAYHGVRCRDEFLARWIRIGKGRIKMKVPTRLWWTWKFDASDQEVLTMTRTNPAKNPIREVKLWRYRWDTVYSGVGGENAKKLADVIRELDVEKAKATGGTVSPLRIKKLNREFSRSYVYTVWSHKKKEESFLRTREIYFKGRTSSFNIEISDFLPPAKGDRGLHKWLRETDGVDLDFILDSITRWEEEKEE